MREFHALIEAHPDYPAGYFHGGQTLERMGRTDDARAMYRDGVEAADRLFGTMQRSGCDAVNIRVFMAGLTATQVNRQIERHGEETLPRLRELFEAERAASIGP